MPLLRNIALSLALIPGAAGVHAADAYPSHEIQFIVPWAPGGSTDIVARKLQSMVAADGLKLIVENFPGATGTIGLARVARAAPDGYTIGMGTTSTLSLAAQGLTDLRTDQFTTIASASIDPIILVVPKNGNTPTLESFLQRMKDNPGKVSIGTPGSNNIGHIFSVMAARAAGSTFIHVPYTGGGRVIIDLAGKQIDAGALKPSESRSQIQAGLVMPIAVFSDERLSFFPNVPTFKEKGYDVFPYGPIVQKTYVVTPAGLPVPIRDRLVAAFRKAIQSDDYKKFANENGFFIDDVTGPALDKEINDMQASFNTMGTKIFSPKSN
jgi:tripartite-type tricarboxylate transporter receptor subunit TctC